MQWVTSRSLFSPFHLISSGIQCLCERTRENLRERHGDQGQTGGRPTLTPSSVSRPTPNLTEQLLLTEQVLGGSFHPPWPGQPGLAVLVGEPWGPPLAGVPGDLASGSRSAPSYRGAVRADSRALACEFPSPSLGMSVNGSAWDLWERTGAPGHSWGPHRQQLPPPQDSRALPRRQSFCVAH